MILLKILASIITYLVRAFCVGAMLLAVGWLLIGILSLGGT